MSIASSKGVRVTQSSSSNDSGKSGKSGQRSSRKPRSRNRNRNRKSASGQANSPRQDGSKKPSNRNNRRRRNNRTGPKLSGFEKVERAYLNLLEKHLASRRKYFELFHRADPRQLEKLERNFSRTVDELRKYEEELKPEYKDEFNQKFNGLRKDLTYSSNHGISPEEDPVSFEGSFEDPHLLPSQINHEFKGDDEESSGTMEDYLKYKGLE